MFDDIICLNRYGETIRSLSQWDLDQTVYINNTNYPVAPIFHWSNQNTDKALVVQSHYDQNQVLSCIIPNQLMIEPYPITCYLYIPETEKGGTVVGMFKLPVRPRPQPNDFEYEDNVEYVRLEDLIFEVQEAELVRNMAENERQAHEAVRVSNENTRVSNEQARQSTYVDMQAATTAAQAAVVSATAATTAANTAATRAETAASQVEQIVSSTSANALKSEGWAVETQNGEPVSSSSPYYHNSARYWAERAQAISTQSLGGLTDVALNQPAVGDALVFDGSVWTNSRAAGDPTPLTTAQVNSLIARLYS